MSLRELFGLAPGPKPASNIAETHTVRKVVEALDKLEPEKARFIAAFGYILGRVANADSHISPEETRAMDRIIGEYGQLPEEQALIVTQTAKMHNQLFGATENFLVTREFSRIATREQKLALLIGLRSRCFGYRRRQISEIGRHGANDRSVIVEARFGGAAAAIG